MINKRCEPFFSVIIPTYNNEKEIRACVNSVLKQTYKNFELIIVDDGSDDRTSVYCDKFENQDERVRVIHKVNEGAASARNTGLFLATGRYVYFVDADDWIDAGLLQEAALILDKPKAPDIYVFGFRMILGEDRTIAYSSYVAPGLYSRKRLEQVVYPRMMDPRGRHIWMPVISAYLCDKIILRELALGHYCRDTSLFMGEESVCAYECMYNARKVYFSTSIMYSYNRLSKSSMQRRYHQHLFTNTLRLAKYYHTYLSRGNKELEKQINRAECRNLKYLIDHEMKFNKSSRWAYGHLRKEMQQVETFPICSLNGLSFFDKCFVLLLSSEFLYFLLLTRRMLICVSYLRKKIDNKINTLTWR